MFFAISKSGDCIVTIQYHSMLCNTDRVYWHQMTSMTARAMMMRSTDNNDDDEEMKRSKDNDDDDEIQSSI